MISKKLLLVFVGIFAVLIFMDFGSGFLELDNVSCKYATNVSASNDFSCILKENGNLDCEGDSNSPDLESDYNGGNAEEISIERNIKCIRKSNGDVDCKGTDFESIGDDFTTGDAIDVSAGSSRDSGETSACIVRPGGALNCKTSGSTGSSHMESVGGDAVQVQVDDFEACVLNSTGDVSCSHTSGGNFNNPVADNPHYNGGDAQQVAFSEDSTLNSNDNTAYVVTRCILKNGGNVDCIGNSSYYGNGHVQDYSKGDAKKVVVDGYQTCVLKDGSNGNAGNVECWGKDKYDDTTGGGLENISFDYKEGDAVDVSIGGLSNYICVARENGDTECHTVGSGFSGGSGGLGSPDDHGQSFNHSCVDPIDRVSESDWAQSGRNGNNNRYAENLSHIDEGIEEKSNVYINSLGQPVLHEGYVYGISEEDGLYKLDASNFSKGVLSNYSGIYNQGTPAVKGDSVYAINYSGSSVILYRFDSENLTTPANSFSFSSAEPIYEPTVSENYVYVSTNGSSASNHLYQFNRSNITQQISAFSASGGLSGPATINENYVYVGGDGGNIYQLDKTDVSTQVFSHSISSSGYTGIPALSGQKIYINEFSQGIYSLNSSDVSQGATVSGSLSARPSSEIATNKKFVYVVDNNDDLNQLNASNISQKISTYASSYSLSDPSATDDHVYMTDAAENFYQLNASNISDTETTIGGLGNYSPVLSSDFAYIRSAPTDAINHNATLYKISGSCNPSASGSWILDGVDCFFNNALDIGTRKMVMKNSANVTLNSSASLRSRKIVVKDSAGIFEIL